MDRGLVTARIHQSPIRTPLNTHRYLVPASLIGGGLRGIRNPDQCPHLHHRTMIDKVARVPATPAGRPRLPGGQELAWRDRGNGNSSGRPRIPGVGQERGCLSLTDCAPESSLRLSQWTPVPRWLLSGLHANYCNQTQVFLILHLTHLLTAVSWVFLPLQTSLNHAPLATLTKSAFLWPKIQSNIVKYYYTLK